MNKCENSIQEYIDLANALDIVIPERLKKSPKELCDFLRRQLPELFPPVPVERKEISSTGTTNKLKHFFPPVDANLIGVVTMIELRSDIYDLNIGLIGEIHHLKLVQCQEQHDEIFPYDYIKEYLIPHVIKSGGLIDFFLERDPPLTHDKQIVQEKIKKLESKGCPFVPDEDNDGCFGYTLWKLEFLYDDYKDSPIPGLRIHMFDTRLNENYDLTYRIVNSAERLNRIKLEPISDSDNLLRINNLIGIFDNLILWLEHYQETPQKMVYKYDKQVNDIVDASLRKRFDLYVKDVLNASILLAISNMIKTNEFLKQYVDLQVSTGSPVSEQKFDYKEANILKNETHDIIMDLGVSLVDFYKLARILRSYTRKGKEGPRAKNVLSYTGAGHTDFYIKFFVDILKCKITREIRSESVGESYECIYLGNL